MSKQVHFNVLDDVAKDYNDYDLRAMDEGYPGIFEQSVPDHELLGRVDLLFSYPEDESKLKAVETGSVSTLSPELIEDKYFENAEQVQKHVTYFENLGYEVDPEVQLRAQGRLGALKRIWEDTTGVFTWNQAREVIADDDILSQFKNDGVILFDSVSTRGSELYSVNEEIEEYEELIDLFYEDVI
jgi:hypothetical protein